MCLAWGAINRAPTRLAALAIGRGARLIGLLRTAMWACTSVSYDVSCEGVIIQLDLAWAV
jgi:hypothetical protein